jgi:hypothetical protein
MCCECLLRWDEFQFCKADCASVVCGSDLTVCNVGND